MNPLCRVVTASFALCACASMVDERREEFLPSNVQVFEIDAGTAQHPITLDWADVEVGAESTLTTGSPIFGFTVTGYFGDVDIENLEASVHQSLAASGRQIQPLGADDPSATITIALDDADLGFMGPGPDLACVISAQVTLTNAEASAARYITVVGTGAGSKNDAIEKFVVALAAEITSHGM